MAAQYNITAFTGKYTPPNIFSNNRSNTSIPYGVASISTYYPKYTTIQQVEEDPEYQAFTKYITDVLNNAEGTTDEDRQAVRQYLNWADTITESSDNQKIDINRFIDESGKFTSQWGQNDDVENIINLFNQRRKDQKFGYYHLTPEIYSQKELTEEQQPEISTNTPKEEPTYKTYKKYLLPELTTPKESKYPGWSDWIPILAKNTADKISTIKNYNLEKQMQYPLQQASYRDSLVTNNYAQRQELERQKSQLLSRMSLMDESDSTQNLKNRLAVEDQIEKVNAQQAQLQTEEFNRTSKERQENINWNKQQYAKTANYNASALKAKFNHLLQAQQAKIAKLNNIFDTTVSDLYQNYGEYLKTKRANEAFKTKRQAQYDYSNKLSELYRQYEDFAKNPYNWDKMKNFITDIRNDASYQFTNEENNILQANTKNGVLNTQDPQVKQIILKAFNSQHPTAVKYQTLFQDAISSKYKDLDIQRQVLSGQMNAALLGLDEYITNQWGPNLFALKRPSILSAKKGSKLDRLTKSQEIFQKEQQSVRENSNKRNSLLQRSLEQELGYINQKTLMMLKSVFK